MDAATRELRQMLPPQTRPLLVLLAMEIIYAHTLDGNFLLFVYYIFSWTVFSAEIARARLSRKELRNLVAFLSTPQLLVHLLQWLVPPRKPHTPLFFLFVPSASASIFQTVAIDLLIAGIQIGYHTTVYELHLVRRGDGRVDTLLPV